MTRTDGLGGAQRLYLEELSVGQRFTSGTHAVDAAQIKAFAAQFDPQPFHLDDEAAKGTLFAGLAASGWHTAAITMRLLVDSGLPIARRDHRLPAARSLGRSRRAPATSCTW